MAGNKSEPGSRWEVLTQTGAGTPMGELLRRYWWPIAGASEFAEPGDQAGSPARRGPRPLQGSGRAVRPARPALPASPRRSQLWLCRRMRPALQLSRLALRRRRRLPGAALRGHGAPRAAAARRNPHQSLSGRGTGRADLGLSRAGAATARAGLGILFLAERVSPDRARRNPLQLVPVPGEFDRPGAFRMDAFELVDPARRQDRPLYSAPPQGRFQRVRVRLPVQAHPRGHRRERPAVADRPRLPVALRPLHRQPCRVPRAGRRREYAFA